MNLTREYLLWLFHYDAPNGKLYWKNHWCKNVLPQIMDKEADTIDQDGYKKVSLNNQPVAVHRLIYLIENHFFPLPKYMLDHINGDRTDNRISNLRVVSNRQNQLNQRRHREGKLPGAYLIKSSGKWRSLFHLHGRSLHLGCFNTELEAHQRYIRELTARGFL